MTHEQRPGRLGNMTTKQKVTIGALVIIVLVIVWQVMGLFGDSTPPPKIAPVAARPSTMSATAPGAASPASPNMSASPATVSPTTAGPATGMMMTPSASMVDTNLRQSPVTIENQLLSVQKQSEEKYVDQINQLQMLKVQREIAETNQAIATARLATVTAEKSVSDLLTKPSQPTIPVGQVPPGAYSGALENPAITGTTLIPPPPAEPTPPPAPTEIPYVVVSVSMQLGRWNAVVGYQGKLYNVSIGDVLPDDESIVTSINKNGVTLMSKKGKRRKISILTAI